MPYSLDKRIYETFDQLSLQEKLRYLFSCSNQHEIDRLKKRLSNEEHSAVFQTLTRSREYLELLGQTWIAEEIFEDLERSIAKSLYTLFTSTVTSQTIQETRLRIFELDKERTSLRKAILDNRNRLIDLRERSGPFLAGRQVPDFPAFARIDPEIDPMEELLVFFREVEPETLARDWQEHAGELRAAQLLSRICELAMR